MNLQLPNKEINDDIDKNPSVKLSKNLSIQPKKESVIINY